MEDAGWAGVTVRADTSPWVSPLLLPEEAEGKSRLRPGADRTMGKTAIEQAEEKQSVKEKLQILKSQSEAKETAKRIKRREQVK